VPGARSAYPKAMRALVQFVGCPLPGVHHLVTAAAKVSARRFPYPQALQVAPWIRGAVGSGLSLGEEAVVAGLCGRLIDTEGTGPNQIHTPAMSCVCFVRKS
jgi:hypothetical protein